MTPPGHWALYDVKKDPGCQNDLAETEADRAAKLAAAYEAWWEDVYPVMVERGGDRDLVWNKLLLNEMKKGKKADDESDDSDD